MRESVPIVHAKTWDLLVQKGSVITRFCSMQRICETHVQLVQLRRRPANIEPLINIEKAKKPTRTQRLANIVSVCSAQDEQ